MSKRKQRERNRQLLQKPKSQRQQAALRLAILRYAATAKIDIDLTKPQKVIAAELESLAGLSKPDSGPLASPHHRCIRALLHLSKLHLRDVPEHLVQHYHRANGEGPKRLARFYESKEWAKLRYWTLTKYGPTCMACGMVDGPMHVDHIKPVRFYWELRLDHNNVQVLCATCNLGKGNQDETDWRK